MTKEDQLADLNNWLGAVKRFAAEYVRIRKSEITYGSDQASGSMVRVCERELQKLTRFKPVAVPPPSPKKAD